MSASTYRPSHIRGVINRASCMSIPLYVNSVICEFLCMWIPFIQRVIRGLWEPCVISRSYVSSYDNYVSSYDTWLWEILQMVMTYTTHSRDTHDIYLWLMLHMKMAHIMVIMCVMAYPLWVADVHRQLVVGEAANSVASTYRYALQHTATHCNALQHTATHCNTLKHTATHCNTLQQSVTRCSTFQHIATHCNTLQHTATHYNTLQHATTHRNTLQHSAIRCNTLGHTALQHTATKTSSTNSEHPFWQPCRNSQKSAVLPFQPVNWGQSWLFRILSSEHLFGRRDIGKRALKSFYTIKSFLTINWISSWL